MSSPCCPFTRRSSPGLLADTSCVVSAPIRIKPSHPGRCKAVLIVAHLAGG